LSISLSHLEIKVRDLPLMEAFYTRVLGFIRTDASPPDAHGRLVFLSANESEHHQIVLREAGDGRFASGSLDHLAFRLNGLSEVRQLHDRLQHYGGLPIETVSHGNSWSVYFCDPEGNRVELFVDTPWHVAQPMRLTIDLSLLDDELIAWTEAKISDGADFQPAAGWYDNLRKRLNA
jgi:catechol 2,3-dioxygenase